MFPYIAENLVEKVLFDQSFIIKEAGNCSV